MSSSVVMSSSVADLDTAIEEMEAYQELLSHAFKRTGKIRPEVLVRHVLGIVPAAEWPVRVEAMDALIRRIESIKQEKLRVESRPADGRLLGIYATRRPGSGARPYRTLLIGRRSDPGPLRLPRLPQELDGPLQAPPRRARTPPRPAPHLAAGRRRSRNGPTARSGTACGGTRSGR